MDREAKRAAVQWGCKGLDMTKRLNWTWLTQEKQVPSLGQEDPLEEEMATYYSIPVWKLPWTDEPGGL